MSIKHMSYINPPKNPPEVKTEEPAPVKSGEPVREPQHFQVKVSEKLSVRES